MKAILALLTGISIATLSHGQEAKYQWTNTSTFENAKIVERSQTEWEEISKNFAEDSKRYSKKPEPPPKPIKIPKFTPYVPPPPKPEPRVFLDGTPIPQLELRTKPKPQPEPPPAPAPEPESELEPVESENYQFAANELAVFAEQSARAYPRPNIHAIRARGEEYIHALQIKGGISAFEATQLKKLFWPYLQQAFAGTAPTPPKRRVPSEAEILADQQRRAIEAQNAQLRRIESAIRDAAHQRSMDEHNRATYRRGTWVR